MRKVNVRKFTFDDRRPASWNPDPGEDPEQLRHFKSRWKICDIGFGPDIFEGDICPAPEGR